MGVIYINDGFRKSVLPVKNINSSENVNYNTVNNLSADENLEELNNLNTNKADLENLLDK